MPAPGGLAVRIRIDTKDVRAKAKSIFFKKCIESDSGLPILERLAL